MSEAQTVATNFTNATSLGHGIRVRDPPEFTNDGKIDFGEWNIKMRIRIINSGEFDNKSPAVALLYILSRTQRDPFERLQVRIPGTGVAGEDRFVSAEDCLDQLAD
jgi:hypothetical protein